MAKSKRKHTSVRFPDDLLSRLNDYALDHDTSLSFVVNNAVREFLDGDKITGSVLLDRLNHLENDLTLSLSKVLEKDRNLILSQFVSLAEILTKTKKTAGASGSSETKAGASGIRDFT